MCEPVRIIRPLPALEVLVELAARRVALGVDVAATKFLAGREIEDPGREEEMLGRVAGRLNAAGDTQGTGLAFFLDQIEASKVIQRGLYAQWREHPTEVPANSRDLATEVRPELDALNDEILPLVVHVADLAPVPYGQLGDLFDRALRTSPSLSGLRELRREAAGVALRSLREPRPDRPAR